MTREFACSSGYSSFVLMIMLFATSNHHYQTTVKAGYKQLLLYTGIALSMLSNCMVMIVECIMYGVISNKAIP